MVVEYYITWGGRWMFKICSKTWWDEQRIHQCVDLFHIIFLFLPKVFTYEVILVDTNRRIKVPALEFGEFLQFIGIWVLIKTNPGTIQIEYFSDTHIDIVGQCSISFKQFMSVNTFESICSDIKFNPYPPTPPYLSR